MWVSIWLYETFEKFSFKWDTRFCCLTVLSENNHFLFNFSFFKLLVFLFCFRSLCIENMYHRRNILFISPYILFDVTNFFKVSEKLKPDSVSSITLTISLFYLSFLYTLFSFWLILSFQVLYLHPINTWLTDSWAWNVVRMKLVKKYINLGFSTVVSQKRNMEDFSLKDHVSRCLNLSHCHPVVIVLFITTL